MKLRVISDLHLEFYEDPDEAGIRDDVDCDAVILAGDIHTGTRGIEWALQTFDRPTVYVLGNHEFYGKDIAKLLQQAREMTWGHPSFWVLENDEVTIDGVRILGATLWSGLESEAYTELEMARLAEAVLQDFRLVFDQRGPLRPQRMVERYSASVAWLESRVSMDSPAVVVTHFAPSRHRDLRHPQYGDSPLVPYFHNQLDHLMGAGVGAWIYGHNHWSAYADVAGPDGQLTPVLSNQAGYPHEDVGFKADYILEV